MIAASRTARPMEKRWPHVHGNPTLYRVRLRLGDVEIDLATGTFA